MLTSVRESCSPVNSAFHKLKNLYARIVPVFEDFGFRPPSSGVIARDLSEKIENAIVQHVVREGRRTAISAGSIRVEVKISKDSRLTINRPNVINGENYMDGMLPNSTV